MRRFSRRFRAVRSPSGVPICARYFPQGIEEQKRQLWLRVRIELRRRRGRLRWLWLVDIDRTCPPEPWRRRIVSGYPGGRTMPPASCAIPTRSISSRSSPTISAMHRRHGLFVRLLHNCRSRFIPSRSVLLRHFPSRQSAWRSSRGCSTSAYRNPGRASRIRKGRGAAKSAISQHHPATTRRSTARSAMSVKRRVSSAARLFSKISRL